jgi:hypothetical protein
MVGRVPGAASPRVSGYSGGVTASPRGPTLRNPPLNGAESPLSEADFAFVSSQMPEDDPDDY